MSPQLLLFRLDNSFVVYISDYSSYRYLGTVGPSRRAIPAKCSRRRHVTARFLSTGMIWKQWSLRPELGSICAGHALSAGQLPVV